MTTKDQIKQDIAEYKEWIAFAKSLKDLKNNKAFKTVILEGYTKNEVINGVHSLSLPDVRSNEALEANILRRINAVSDLVEYMRLVELRGYQSEQDLALAEEELTKIEFEE